MYTITAARGASTGAVGTEFRPSFPLMVRLRSHGWLL